MDYSFQKPLVKETYEKILKSGKTVVLAACPGAGKTHMGLEVVKKFLDTHEKSKCLIFTHGQTILRDQWADVVKGKASKLTSVVITEGKDAKKLIKSHDLILCIPQTITNQPLATVDLVVVDEAHQRFLAEEMQIILSELKPKFILCLTGTPSYFLHNDDYAVVGITIEELLDFGVITDPLIEIVQSDYEYDLADFDKSTYSLKEGKLNHYQTVATLDNLFPQILRKLTSAHRTKPEQFQWIGQITSWQGLSDKLKKTMVICNNQQQAIDTTNYFNERGIKATVSVSDISDGSEELENFKKDDSVRVFVVVNRGTLGFNYEELINLIDLSGTLNVNRIFQALCRVVRPSHEDPTQKKLYIKATSKEMAELTYFVMSFVVALSTKEYYYNYTTEYRIDIPVEKEFVEGMERLPSTVKPFPNLPKLLTFTDLKNRRLGMTGSIAYTDFKTVIKKLYTRTGRIWTTEQLKESLKGYKSRKDFMMHEPSQFHFIMRNGMQYLLIDRFGMRIIWTEKKVFDCMKKSGSVKEFKKDFPGAFGWLIRNKRVKELYESLPMTPQPKISYALMDELLGDKKYKVTETGKIYKDGTEVKYSFKGETPYFKYKDGKALMAPRIIYYKFKGKIPRNKYLTFRKFDRKNPYLCAVSNLKLGASNGG